ncbi:MAG: hypothetical protein ACXADY_10210 [Candidatus Hodarchaeales archaeon]|jgi:hypothetical protein
MTQNQEKIKKTLGDFVNYFNNKKIPYVLVGGLAVNFWGRIRSTMDADFIIDDKKLNYNDFISYLQNKGYAITLDDVKRGFLEKSNITIWSNFFRIDFKGIYNNFAKQTIESAITLDILDMQIKVDSPEFLIISKIIYGSEQDFEDAASIYLRLKEKKRLQFDKLDELASKLDISDRLEFLETLANEEISEDKLEQIIENLKPFDFSKLEKFQ